VLDAIVAEVARVSPGVVVVDSFRTVVRKIQSSEGDWQLQGFIQGSRDLIAITAVQTSKNIVVVTDSITINAKRGG